MKKIENMNPVEAYQYIMSLIKSSPILNRFERQELVDAALVQLLASVEIVG